jgi:hypothetical protein
MAIFHTKRIPVPQTKFQEKTVFGRFADRFSEARQKSQYLTFPFAF